MPGSVSTVETRFAGDDTYQHSSDSDPFSILKEDCTLAYSGSRLVNAGNTTRLAADMSEPDSSLGDRSNKSLTFTVFDASNNAETFAAATDASGHAEIQASLGPNVYRVSVSFAGDDYYKPCKTAADTIVTVEGAKAKVTGGGWISQAAGRTNFGFNAIPYATGLRGQIQVRPHSAENKFHGDVVLSLSASGNTATWTGTGVWNGVAGYAYSVSVVDNGSSGNKTGDTISIVVKSRTNVTVFTTSGSQRLKGGNITIH